MKKVVTEAEAVEKIAAEYKHAGYDVVVQPKGEHLPEALRPFRPDLLAKRGDETVVVEIKSRRELATEQAIAPLAERVERIKGWRLEVQVVEASPHERWRQGPPMSLEETKARLESTVLVVRRKDYASALVLAWSAFEAVLRHLSWQADLAMVPWNGQRAAKQLFAIGALSRSDYEMFMRGLEARNQVVHGGSASQRELSLVRSVISTVRRLLDESNKSNASRVSSTPQRSSRKPLRARR